MSHMVIYRGSDGKPGYHQTDDIHDAVGFVERMRNDNGVEHARIFRLEEVVFEYKPYFRVELSDGTPVNRDVAVESGAGTAALPADSSSTDTGSSAVNGTAASGSDDANSTVAVADDPANEEPKRGLFGR